MSDVAVAAAGAQAQPVHSRFWKEGGFSFHDLLDTINPLQHLPIIATIYRWATGDEPGNVARVVGDGLYGGPIGAALGLANAATRNPTGQDMGERVMTWAFGKGHSDSPAAPATAVACNNPTPANVAALYRSAGVPAVSRTSLPPVQTAAALPRSAPGDAAAGAFFEKTASLQRQLTPPPIQGTAAVASKPIPLQLSGRALPSRPPAPAPVAPAKPAAAASDPSTTAAAAAAVATATPTPTEISAKMMSALDKYMRLQKQHPGDPGAATDSVDVTP